MQLISKFKKGVVPLKDKKVVYIVNTLSMHFKKSQNNPLENLKRYEQTKVGNFITILLKNGSMTMIVMYATHNEKKSVVPERFIEP